MEDKEKKKKDKNSPNSDRVTLKKEIGLLSACAIIIGEYVTAFDANYDEPADAVSTVTSGNVCEQPAGAITAISWQMCKLLLWLCLSYTFTALCESLGLVWVRV